MKAERRLNAVIVEDDRKVAGAMRFALAKRGVDATIVGDPSAVLAPDAPRPDVFVIDIVIEGSPEGFVLLDALRSHPRLSDVPRIVVSDYGTRSDVSRARALGAKEYLMKADHDLADVADTIAGLAKGS